MARQPERIDPERLRRLRELISGAQPSTGYGLPLDRLAELADESRSIGNITIDYRTVPDLGYPMVVLHAEPTVGEPLFELTAREIEVAKLIALGLSNKEIAVKLGITLLTTKDHVHRILEKSGLPNRAAVAAAVRPN
ncbi:MAG: helix-turn-helix transcriptional regulator [Chlorobia bacterium]|nr:helix-turn-helix transcriptional regulator [Fimbriimonadaceae bacterium]